MNHHQAVSRTEIGRKLWPNADDKAARNRIRTALVNARSCISLSNAIKAEKLQITLNAQNIKCDLWKAKILQKRIAQSLDLKDECSAMITLLEIIKHPFLPEFSDDWISQERDYWNNCALATAHKLSNVYQSNQNWNDSIKILELALTLSPYDETTWTGLFRAYSIIGQHIAISNRFKEARVALAQDYSSGFSPNILNLAETIRKGTVYNPKISISQESIITRTYGRMAAHEPDKAAVILGSEQFRPEVYRSPKATLEMLEPIFQNLVFPSESYFQCLANMILASSLQNDHNSVKNHALKLLSQDKNESRLRGSASALAFAFFQVREWDQAQHYGQLALSLSIKERNEYRIALAKSQLASFEWHQGNFEKAISTYTESLSILSKSEAQDRQASEAAIFINLASIYFIQDKFQLANIWIIKGVATAESCNNLALLNLAYPLSGTTLCFLDDPGKGCPLVSRGLIGAYRSSDPRTLQIAFELSAITLAKIGNCMLATKAKDHATQLRSETNHLRSPAEEQLLIKINQLCGVKSRANDINQLETRSLIASILKALAQKDS